MTLLVVGGGKMGLSHLALASQMLGKDSVALCDASFPLRFAYRSLGFRTFPSIDAAIDQIKGGVSAAIIATPTPSHHPVARLLLGASVPCLVEKPLTLKPAQSAELVELARSRNLHGQVGFVLRYVATFVALRELVSSTHLGRAVSYRARMCGNVITGSQSDTWRSDFSRGGGCLNEYGPHLIDLCRYAFGDVAEITGAEATQVHSRKADDRLAASWSHLSGTLGEIALDWCDTTRRKSVIQIEAEFENGRVLLDNSSLKILEAAPTSEAGRARLDELQSFTPPQVSYYLRGEEYSLQLEDFLGRCTSRRFGVTPFGANATPAMLDDGLQVDRLIETLAAKAGLS